MAAKREVFIVDEETGELIPEKPKISKEWNMLQQAIHAPPYGWLDVFRNNRSSLKLIQRHLDTLGDYYPRPKDIFTALRLTPLDQVKVVIVGQDPYHTKGKGGRPVATGMSFSVRPEDDIPPSLVNIFKEIERTHPEYVPKNRGDLTHWAKQGVLLLNTCFTVSPGSAGSHKDIWMPFVNAIVKEIMDKRPKTLFVLWGAKAKTTVGSIIGHRAKSLEAAHPSPINTRGGFIGCDHFLQINAYLKSKGCDPIEW